MSHRRQSHNHNQSQCQSQCQSQSQPDDKRRQQQERREPYELTVREAQSFLGDQWELCLDDLSYPGCQFRHVSATQMPAVYVDLGASQRRFEAAFPGWTFDLCGSGRTGWTANVHADRSGQVSK